MKTIAVLFIFSATCSLNYFVFEHFTYPGLKHTVANPGVKHMCCGTLSPFYYAETTLVRMHFSDNSPEELDMIKYKNIQPHIK